MSSKIWEPGAPSRPASRSRSLKRPKITQEGIVVLLAAALFLCFSIFLKGFAAPGNLVVLVRSVSVLGILGLGMGVVVIGRGLDLAMVSTMVIASSIALMLGKTQFPLPIAVLVGLIIVLAVGLINGILIAYAEIPAIFTTLAMGAAVFGFGRAAFLKLEAQNVPADAGWFNFVGGGALLGVPMPIVFFGIVALLAHLLLTYTRIGRYIYAVGDNPLAAEISGLPRRSVIVAQYCASSLVAYLAGVVMAAAVGGTNTRLYNSTMIYDVLLVVVLGGIGLGGGRGGVRNVLVGTFMVGVILNGMTIMDIPYAVQNLLKGLILLLALVIDTFVNPRDEQTAQQGDI